MTRIVDWGGLHNTRDLGGLAAGATETRYGQFFRAPRPDTLTAEGWDAMVEAGVRTIIDLRNDNEVRALDIPSVIEAHRRPIEDQGDADFMAQWGDQLGSPVYYADNLVRWPDRIAEVFRVFASAADGGIVFHCSAGRDRTGLITAMLLQLAGVPHDVIVDDYALSVVAMNDFARDVDDSHERPKTDAELETWLTEVRHQMATFLHNTDTAAFLEAHGMTPDEVARVRARLVGE